jgi:hypothetical protein
MTRARKEHEFRIRHRDVPEDVQQRLGRAVGEYSIPIVLDWQFLPRVFSIFS